MSLVGANLLTKIFEPCVVPLQTSFIENVTSIIPSELCKKDFGCDRNVCWRACGDESDDTKKNKLHSWC